MSTPRTHRCARCEGKPTPQIESQVAAAIRFTFLRGLGLKNADGVHANCLTTSAEAERPGVSFDFAMADETAQPNAEDPIRAGMKEALQEMIAFAQKLIETDVPAEKIWFRNLLIGLLNSTRQNYLAVEIGTAKMPALASWGGA